MHTQHNEKKRGDFWGSAEKVRVKKHRGHGRRPNWKSGVGVGLPRARGHCLADSGAVRAEGMRGEFVPANPTDSAHQPFASG